MEDLPLIGIINLIDEPGATLSGSETGDMALTNMRGASIRERWWRSTNGSAVVLEGAFPGLRDVNIASFAQPPEGVRLTVSDTVRLRLYDGASEVHDTGVIAAELSYEGYWSEVIPAGVTADSFRFDFGLAVTGYVQIGRLWLCNADQLRFGPTFPLVEGWAGGGSNLLAPASGVRVPREEPLRRVRSLEYEALRDAAPALARIQDRTASGTRQVLYCETPLSDPTGALFFGVFGDGQRGAPPGQTLHYFRTYRRSVTITEDL